MRAGRDLYMDSEVSASLHKSSAIIHQGKISRSFSHHFIFIVCAQKQCSLLFFKIHLRILLTLMFPPHQSYSLPNKNKIKCTKKICDYFSFSSFSFRILKSLSIFFKSEEKSLNGHSNVSHQIYYPNKFENNFA